MDIETLLKMSLEKKASDLHIMPNRPPLMRIDGDLVSDPSISAFTPQMTQDMIYNIMTEEQQHTFKKDLSIDIAIFFNHLGNFRVNVFHTVHGVACVLRIVPEKIPTIDELGLPNILKRLLVLPHGLILVTGATGSGKSTTLAGMVNYINTIKAAHIITIEDPIEYLHESKKGSINQLQVGRDTLSFASALRHSLRQDPDVIMIGEMRDLESIRLALTAAETGHLVLSTLHASSAAITISRIVDIFPSAERSRVRNLLSETLQGVLCQTLVKKMTSGRTAAFEVMLASPAIRHLINQGMNSHLESTIQTSGDLGMFTLEQNLKELISRGIISPTSGRVAIAHRDSMKFSEAGKKSVGDTMGMNK